MKTADEVTSNTCIRKALPKTATATELVVECKCLQQSPFALPILIFPQCKKHPEITIKHTEMLK